MFAKVSIFCAAYLHRKHILVHNYVAKIQINDLKNDKFAIFLV